MVLITILHELNISLFYKQVSVYLICFLPNYMLLSVALLRETMITFFLALSILFFIRWFNKSRGEIAFLLAIFFAFMGSMFHGAVGMIAVVYIIIRLVYSPIERKYQLYYKNILYALIFLIVFTVSFRFLGGVIFKKVIDKIDKIDFDEVNTVVEEERGRGGSNYAKYVGDPSSPVKIVIYALPRYLYYMYSPFPWQWRGMVDILTFIFSSAVYLYILVKALLYIQKTSSSDRYRNLLIALVGIALIMGEIFSWGVSNTGTATRHRDKFIALYMVMLALGSKIEKEPKSQPAANDASLTKL